MRSDFCKKSEQAICSLLRRGTIRQIYYLDRYLRHWAANPAQRIAAESEEKARPAYEKALRPFHRLRAFSELGSVNTFDTALLGRAASAASIRNEVESCHRRNSLPPLNDEMVLRPAPSGRSPIKTPRRMSWRFDWCPVGDSNPGHPA